ncbi:acyl carrier protein [Azospirillum sp. RWY-5-1]|uniref:Acyl carrier protein n=1 Tax=Azospirillum oleiclasticum TaxID=2735135 RepID=A0ABX2TBH1_9PROT|nr:phosphopantetheine-binding protein [Azospirillum oleiclasticum]NYZ13440.1 acyl carrier protein [Azospirillum oleiclasticum]NYZ20601.1 acyl carrier protein [Azospirillum oleiclasticum]
MTDAAEDVLAIMAEKGRVERAALTPDAKLADLGIASLDVIEIVFAIEDRLGVEIPFNPNDARTEFVTVGDVLEAVRAVVAAKPASA